MPRNFFRPLRWLGVTAGVLVAGCSVQMPLHRLHQTIGRMGIAENAMVDALMQSRNYNRRRTEIHIRHPERNNVAPLVFIPFFTTCGAAINMCIKIKYGTAHITHLWTAHYVDTGGTGIGTALRTRIQFP